MMSPLAAGMAYEVHGGRPEGRPPLVLIHGAGGSRLFWPPELRRLEGAAVYALDLPGHGRSPGAGRDRIERYVEDLMGWMEALRLDRCVLVGHSMGCAVALMAALTKPAAAAGLVLVGGGGRLRVHPVILEKVACAETYPEAVDLIVGAAYGPRADPRLIEMGRRRMLEVPAEVVQRDLLACDAFDILGRLSEVLAPTLVLCGEHDRLTPEKYSRRLGESIPRAEVEIVPDAGHMVMLERPRAVADAVGRFLRKQFPLA